MEKARLHIFVDGIVQGVFFRASTRKAACESGLNGWVRNCWDGRVEAVFEGERDKIENVLEWCRKGPPGARVRNVEIRWEQPTGEYNNFSIR